MTAIHMNFFRDLYAKPRASWCSVRDAEDILVTSKCKVVMKQVIVMMSKTFTL